MMISTNDLNEIIKFKDYLKVCEHYILYNQMNSVYTSELDKLQIQQKCYEAVYGQPNSKM